MGLSQPAAGSLRGIDELDRFTRLNVLALLGQTINEVRRGNELRAFAYLGITLVAFKYRKVSFALQGVMMAERAAERFLGRSEPRRIDTR